jgi:hypothetical protein
VWLVRPNPFNSIRGFGATDRGFLRFLLDCHNLGFLNETITVLQNQG